jgi:hypothetical protein
MLIMRGRWRRLRQLVHELAGNPPATTGEATMKAFLAVSVTVLCALAMTACAVDEPSEATDEQSGEVVEMAKIVYVPPELSFAQLEGTFDGNQFTGTTNACHVTLLFCRDSRFGNLPSFCQNGDCGGAQGATIARSLCLQVCGNINCNTLIEVLPRRASC